jgi:hypothetical protein
MNQLNSLSTSANAIKSQEFGQERVQGICEVIAMINEKSTINYQLVTS